ncbi:MAG TPA: ABC transporter permease [Acidobacteriaceae bacterium]
MRWLDQLRLRLQMLLTRGRAGDRLDAELQFHLEQQIDENRAAGMSAEEARYAALRSFGNPTALRDETRANWSWNRLETLWQDARFALRQVRRTPGFAVTAILTLALGIGANTAIFTLTHALLLSSLPVPDPKSLVRLSLDFHRAEARSRNAPLSLPMIESIRQGARSYSGVFGWSVYDFVLQDKGGNRGLRGATVSGNTFDVLMLRPAAGRLLQPSDDQPGGGPDGWAAVISYRLWMEQYHGDTSVVGRHVTVTDHGATIVGVAPPGFEGVIVGEHPDLYLPVEFSAALSGHEEWLHDGRMLWLTVFARLKPSIARSRAQGEATTLLPWMLKSALPPAMLQMPEARRLTLDVEAGRTGWSNLRLAYTEPLLLLQGMVGAVLLICCANLSGLLLARASARQQEFAIRGALGAARSRLMRQLFVESLLLAAPGALLGVGLAWLAGPWLLQGIHQSETQAYLSTRPDLAVLAITAGCACLCALFFGMAPAWAASRTNLEAALRSGSRRAGGSSSTTRRIFVPLQVALSLTLVVVAALLGATVVRLRTDNTGFRTQNVIFWYADFGRLQQKGVDLLALYRRIQQRMEEQPGVEAASVSSILPFYGSSWGGKFTASADAQHATTLTADIDEIGAHYFATVGTQLLAGRDLRNEDGDRNSCVVSQRAAALFFPHGSALGQMLHEVDHNPQTGVTTVRDCQIVGIAENTKFDTVEEGLQPIVYYPLSSQDGMFFAIHARSFDAARAAYHTALHELAPTAPETDPATFAKLFSDSIAREQLLSGLSGFFALLALLLSGIGIYGLLSWSVTQRRTEIGVRMALGATRGRVFLLVLRQTALLLGIGIAAGGVGAFFAARAVSSFLFEVHAESPAVFAGAAMALVLIALIAASLPARRAVAIDPMEALRTE